MALLTVVLLHLLFLSTASAQSAPPAPPTNVRLSSVSTSGAPAAIAPDGRRRARALRSTRRSRRRSRRPSVTPPRTRLSGVTVTFTAPASGASARFNGSATATAVTGASGVATAPPSRPTGQPALCRRRQRRHVDRHRHIWLTNTLPAAAEQRDLGQCDAVRLNPDPNYPNSNANSAFSRCSAIRRAPATSMRSPAIRASGNPATMA